MSDDDFDDMFGGGSGSDDNANANANANEQAEAEPQNNLEQNVSTSTSTSTFIPPEMVPNMSESELQYQQQLQMGNSNIPPLSPPENNYKDDESQSHTSKNSDDFDDMFGESSEDDEPVQIIRVHSSNIRVPRKSKQGGATATAAAARSLRNTSTSRTCTSHQASADALNDFPTNTRGESPISNSSRKRQRPPTPPYATTRIRKKKPEDYKSFTMDDFWKSLRSWDFVWELNEQMKRNPKQQQQSTNEQDSDLCTIVSSSVRVQPLPDDFDCVEQYVALWAPLQLEETKAQILSDVISSRTVSFQKLTQPIQATPRRTSDSYSEHLALDIVSRSVVAGPNDGASSQNTSNSISRKRSNAGGGGGGVEFLQNDLVLITCDSSIVEQAYKGTLRPPDTKSSYSMSSLLSMASPFVEGRLAIVGVVSARCKGLDGLVVNVSKRLWKDKSLGARDLFLLKLGTNVTGEFFIGMDVIHVALIDLKMVK